MNIVLGIMLTMLGLGALHRDISPAALLETQAFSQDAEDKNIRDTIRWLDNVRDYQCRCVVRDLKQQTAQTIHTPKISFCTLASGSNEVTEGEYVPVTVVVISYICSRPMANELIISVDGEESVYPLHTEACFGPPLGIPKQRVAFDAFYKLDRYYEILADPTHEAEVCVYLGKDGKKISEGVLLKTSLHKWGNKEARNYVYPWPGEVYSMAGSYPPAE